MSKAHTHCVIISLVLVRRVHCFWLYWLYWKRLRRAFN